MKCCSHKQLFIVVKTCNYWVSYSKPTQKQETWKSSCCVDACCLMSPRYSSSIAWTSLLDFSAICDRTRFFDSNSPRRLSSFVQSSYRKWRWKLQLHSLFVLHSGVPISTRLRREPHNYLCSETCNGSEPMAASHVNCCTAPTH